MAKKAAKTPQVEALEFQAEVQQLLNILAHSLYTERDVFLRELISNASDALNRVQFEMLTNREVLDPDAELAIHIDFDEEANTLTVSDTGIGMTREELVENLGTIAHSGAMAFLKRLEEGERPGDIIGQFGVGFYSVFMVADDVQVTARSYRPDAEAWTWTSRGENTYTLTPAEKPDRGTSILIKLKEDATEYASAWKLEQIIKKHSDFIAFPIYVKDKAVNQRTAIWRKSPQEVSEEEYQNFYRQLTLDFEKPLLHVHMVTDVPVDIHSILFVPRRLDRGVLNQKLEHGVRLYSRNVLIQEHNKDLLPKHFRFVEGVVDSEDIPLNISRESVQSDPTLRRIRKALTGQLVRSLRELAQKEPEEYAIFWTEFGPFVKEGLITDPSARDDLLPLLRFRSSKSLEAWISLADYRNRMAANQEALYYVLGEDLQSLERSPHLDHFRVQDLEVLYLTDPLDGFLMQTLQEVEGKPLKNVDDAGLELPEQDAEEIAGEQVEHKSFEALVARIKSVLGDRVLEVRESRMLRDNPCRLVSPEDSPDRDLQRIRRLVEKDYEAPAKILEINRRHPLIRNLAQLVREEANESRINPLVEQLYENLLLLEGLHPNPAQMVPRLQTLLELASRPAAGPDSGEGGQKPGRTKKKKTAGSS